MVEVETVAIFRDLLRKNKFYSNKVIVEEQISNNPRIKKLLQNASKSGPGSGRPEFIIQHKELDDFLIVVECKDDIKKHESKNRDKFKDYAVDGALLYSQYLSKEYDVLSIAISGNKKNLLRKSFFLQLKGEEYTDFELKDLIQIEDLIELYLKSNEKKKTQHENILKFSIHLNTFLHKNKIQETKRALLFSGILVALKNRPFSISYKKHKNPKSLTNALLAAIYEEFSQSDVFENYKDVIKNNYAFIKTHKTLTTSKDFLITMISEIDKSINKFNKSIEYHDLLGEFYIEFLKYANSDKSLGIVLTPPHITELFCEIAEINKDSIVFDNCCGTAGFLISSMKKILKDVTSDKEILKIKNNNFIGVEYMDDIFTLSASNMILHGDGKSRMYNENCFDENLINKVKKLKPNVGFLNPPYKTDKDDTEELEFILNNLDVLQKGATCVSIIPVSCVNEFSGNNLALKEIIQKKHTVLGVMSVPQDLFHNSKTNVVTCLLVIKAHEPHPDNFKTYLGYWREDLFEKRKNLGRIDIGAWTKVRKNWLDSYRNTKNTDGIVKMKDIKNIGINGFGLRRVVKPNEEWCVENYLETDYTDFDISEFEKTLKSYMGYKLIND